MNRNKRGKFFDFVGLLVGVIIVLTIIFAELKFKSWQCEELFPNSSLLACILWK